MRWENREYERRCESERLSEWSLLREHFYRLVLRILWRRLDMPLLFFELGSYFGGTEFEKRAVHRHDGEGRCGARFALSPATQKFILKSAQRYTASSICYASFVEAVCDRLKILQKGVSARLVGVRVYA